MKFQQGLIVALALLLAGPLAAQTGTSGTQPPAYSLLDIYRLAQQNDPSIREAQAFYQAGLEARPQALSALLPQIGAGATWTWNEPSIPGGEGLGWNVQLRQSIFHYDQWLGLQQADRQIAQSQLRFQAAQQDLILRTAEAYFNVLAAQDMLVSARASREAIREQLEQIQQRFQVGLSAITDVQEAQAAHDRSVADEIAAERVLSSAREGLRELTGLSTMNLAVLRNDVPLEPPQPQLPEAWVDTALAQNLELLITRIEADLAQGNLDIARSGRYPSLDLMLQHADRGGQSSQTLSLQLSIPLYTGGAISSRVNQASHLLLASREAAERVSRQVERQTRDAYLGIVSDISRVQALQQTLRSSEVALEAAQTGLQVGTRTTVDVLNGQRQLLAAQTEYARARYDYLLNGLRLKRAAGILQFSDLESIDTWLSR